MTATRVLRAPMVWVLLALATPLGAAPFQYANTTGGNFDDKGGAAQNPLVRTFTVTDDFTVDDLDVGLHVLHVDRGDVTASLEGPDGTSVAFIVPMDTTDSNNHYSIVLDDASANPLDNNNDDSTGTPYQRTVAPSFALSSFNGKRALGTWTLRIWDRQLSAGSERVGTFNEATLYFDGTAIVPPAVEANRIKGIVFRDYDADGVQDVREPGVAGVTVVARNVAGVVLSSTTSGTDGAYVLSVADGVNVRVEFLGLPAYLAPGPTAAGVGSSVQFVTAPAAQIDFATHNPAEHVGSANPMILVPCYENGLPAGNTNAAFVAIPYTAEGQPLAYGGAAVNPRVDASVEELGAVWGVAYQPVQQRAFTSAFLKRHVGFADGPGYVYILDYATAGVPLAGSFDLDGVSPANGGGAIDLGSVDRSTVDAGNNYVLGDPSSPNRDYDAFGKVGTMSFGDADLSEDGNTLFIVNLNQRALITVDVSGPSGSLPGTVNQYPLGGLTVDGGPQTFDGLAVNGVMRPWGLEFRDGVGYLGVVNDASSGTAADLRGYVFTFDPTNPAAGLTQVLDFAINWSREFGHGDAAPGVGDWQPWGLGDWFTVNPQLANSDDNYMAPQPILSGLEVNERGDIVIGITDRFSHQNGRQNYRAILDDPGSPDGGNPNEVLWDTSSMGDVIHACWNGSAYVMEGSAGCPVNDNNRLTGDPTNTLRQDDGLAGTGEYYYQDQYMESDVGNDGYLSFVHGETATGALAHLPGTENVISTQYDPLWLPEFGRIVNAQGLVWYDTFNGPRTQAYQVVESSDTSPQTFAKSNGLGDLELISEVAPIEIGNRVWNDIDGNGVQDPGESIYSGVTVTLHDMDAAGAQVGSATTDANGVYLFGGSSDANMTSGSVLPDRNYQLRIALTSGPLANRVPTLSNAGINDLHDSDAMLYAGSAVIAFTTGGAGENDHTLDFGFGPENGGLGNLVYHDANGNGTYDSGEGIGGVTVEVYELFTIPGTDPPYATAVTLPDGAYAVTGLPDSSGLPNGPYTVHIPASQFQAGGPLEGLRSLPLHGSDTQTDDDADENGIDNSDPATNGITAADVSIVAGTEPNAAGGETGFESTSDDGPRDADVDLTVDFAFYDLADVASVSNFVWVDTNGNGIQDGGEVGFDGLTVNLLDASGTTVLWADTTSGGGFYTFANLAPGSYVLDFAPPGGYALTVQDAGGNDTLDSDPDPLTDRVSITLAPGENDDSVDAGVYQPATIGNFVWMDADGDGIENDGVSGIDGVTVNLWNGTETQQLATTSTSFGGLYGFGNLAPGSYVLEFVTPGGHSFTLQDAGGDDALDSDADPADGRADAITVVSGQTVDTIDAGMYQPGAINGFVRKDLNGDGSGDSALSGVTVYLDLDNSAGFNAGDVAATTNGSGFYAFTGLVPGSYDVGEVDLANYRSVGDNDGGDFNLTMNVTVTSGTTTPNIDFSDEELGAISGTVRADTDNNDTGDTPIASVTVFLDIDSSGTLNAGDVSTITSGAGTYTFTGLIAGDYDVIQVDLAGYQSVSDTDGGNTNLTSPVTVTVGATTANIDFVDEELGAISGTVRADTDNDDTGDTPLASVTVFLDIDSSGTLNAGDVSTTTSGAGTWSFTSLAPGNYNVVQVDLAGYQSVSDTDGGDANLTSPVAVTAGATTANIDFVDEELGAISGTVRADTDNNDTGDTPLPGVTVFLDIDSSGTLNAGDVSTTTSGAGTWSFTGLAPGSYDVIQVDLAGYQSVSDTDGGDANITSPVTVTAGATTASIDFVDEELGAISGTVRADTDNNDTGDTPIASVTVFLDIDSSGTLNAGDVSTTTSGAGTWSFTGLAPGSYDVIQVDLAGYQSVSDTDGGDPNLTSPVAVTAGATTANIDFVDEELGAISGTVRADTDNNDTGDTPLPGVTVFLDIDSSGTLNAGDVSTTTSGTGTWSFTGLAPGSYDVIEVDLAGYQSISDTDGGDPNLTSPVAVTAGATTANIDFVDEELGAISGTVRADTDNNDTGDTPLASVTVFLDIDSSGTLNAGDVSTTTSGAGTYSFTGLAPGNYDVIQVDLANYQSVSDTDGGDANLTSPVAVTAGATTANIDFVDEELGALGNKVWGDRNGNGIDDDGTNLNNVVVNLLDPNNGFSQVATTMTDSSGIYSFTSLAPGDYVVEFVPPANRYITTADVGSDDTIDSDPDPVTGRTATVTLSAGETNDTIDAGLYQHGAITGTVEADTNNDDAGDVPLSGVKVFLDKNKNGVQDGGRPRPSPTPSGSTPSWTSRRANMTSSRWIPPIINPCSIPMGATSTGPSTWT